MKNDPRYGYYPWWPENGNDWLHSEDVDLARQLIPSMRIFRRHDEQAPAEQGTSEQGEYILLHYNEAKLRVLRTLWQEVEWEGFSLGDWVEVLTRGRRNSPHTGTIREMLWHGPARAIRYQVLENDQPIAKLYAAEDLRHIDTTNLGREAE